VTSPRELENDSAEAIPSLLDVIYYQKSRTPRVAAARLLLKMIMHIDGCFTKVVEICGPILLNALSPEKNQLAYTNKFFSLCNSCPRAESALLVASLVATKLHLRPDMNDHVCKIA